MKERMDQPSLQYLTATTVVLHESGVNKAISWSVTAYNKNVFSQ